MTGFVAGLGVLTVMLDAAVNLAFPAISAAFGVPVTGIQWVVLAYIGVFAGALLPAGRLGDRAGHARVFRLGLGITGVAHLAAGLAPTWAVLLGGRVVQGVGAALVMASAPALVTLATPAERRGRALGRLGVAASLGMVLGPLVGGVLLDALGWRIVYLGRLPLVAAALGIGARLDAGAGAPDLPGRTARPRAAPAGTDGLRIADLRAFLVANALHLLANAALFAIWLLVPYDLLGRRDLPAALGGLVFTAGPLAWACAAPLGGRLADQGMGRWVPSAALAGEAAGLWWVGRLDAEASSASLAAALGLAGFGYGLFLVPNTHDVMTALPRARQGLAAGLVALMRTAGILVGAQLTTAVYAARLAAHGARGLGGAAAEAAAFGDALGAAAGLALLAAALGVVPPRARRRVP
jgi:MFS family permease